VSISLFWSGLLGQKGWDMLTRIVELLRAKKVFVRERTPMEIRALEILLVYLGLSYRKTEEVLRLFGGRQL